MMTSKLQSALPSSVGIVYVIQRSEPSPVAGAVSGLKFVTVYAAQEEAVIFAETALEQLHAQMLINGFHKIVRKEIEGDITIGLVNMKTDTTTIFYVIQKVRVL